MELDGKVALVTGGARRVGRALTLGLARAGADVVINYHRSAAEAEALAAEIRAMGRRALPVAADVASGSAIDDLLQRAADAFGRLDVLVNNASTFESAPLDRITEADWDRVMAVNLRGPFLLSQRAAPLLSRDGGGVIVNMADLSGLQAWPSYAHHAVSKAGLVHLTRVLARALGPAVRVNCIAPGTVLPPEDASPDTIRASREKAVLGRIGSPEDVVKALLFLIASDFVTGQLIIVDGGRILT